MNKRTWKLYWICTCIITIVLLIIRIPFGLGWLAGCLLSAGLLKFTDISWSAYITQKSLNKGTILLNFLGKYAIYAAFLVLCAMVPNILNIFAGAAGLILVKPVIILNELLKTKGEQTV